MSTPTTYMQLVFLGAVTSYTTWPNNPPQCTVETQLELGAHVFTSEVAEYTAKDG
jgi:hypothetical protein